MIFSQFISSRIRHPEKKSFSAIIGKIAVGGVGSGIFIMLISYAILYGFQENIQHKIFGFGGHIQLARYDINTYFQESSIIVNDTFLAKCAAFPPIKNISLYGYKAGLIKTNEEVLGTVLKGVDKNFDPEFYNKNMLEGRFIDFNDTTGSKEINISRKIAEKLNLKINDNIIVYFVQDPPRLRKLKIVGVYETGMEEFDEAFILGDLNLLRRINNWPDNMAGGYEITVKDFSKLNITAEYVYNHMDYDLGMEKITDKYVTIFDWLTLLDQNVKIFLALIILVACFNMISCLFIMIMERTNMIGILKALGATNGLITKIFFMNGMSLIIKGLIWGNLFAVIFCVLQYYLKIIPLEKENYYMDAVPILWDWPTFFVLNMGVIGIMSIVLLLPSLIILRISPIRSIKFN